MGNINPAQLDLPATQPIDLTEIIQDTLQRETAGGTA